MNIGKILFTIKDITKSYRVFNNIDYKGIESDSRKIKENYIFVALKGSTYDGHQFIYDAYKKGAKLFVIEKRLKKLPYIQVSNTHLAFKKLSHLFFPVNFNRMKLTGITGTNGKTTVIYLLHHILTSLNLNSSMLSTVEIKIKNEVIEEPYNTTPNLLELLKIMKLSQDKNIDFIQIEVSSHAIAQERIWGIPFDVVGITNITRDHLDYHKDMEDYKRTKLSLFKYLKDAGIGIVNVDSIDVNEVPLSRDKILTYGRKGDFSIENVEYKEGYMEFTLVYPDGKVKVRSSIIGEYNAYNITLSLATLWFYKLNIENILDKVFTFKGVRGRFQILSYDGIDFKVVVDFAHTPDALEKVLKTARKITEGRIILVFGAGGGNADKGKRPIMGKIATELADISIITDDDPKDEDPEIIISDILKGVNNQSKYLVIRDRKEAIKTALGFATKGDMVIIAGRGHERYQILANGKKPFDDYKVAMELLKELK